MLDGAETTLKEVGVAVRLLEVLETEAVAAATVTEAARNGCEINMAPLSSRGIAAGAAITAMAGRGTAATEGLVETWADETVMALAEVGGGAGTGTKSRSPWRWTRRYL